MTVVRDEQPGRVDTSARAEPSHPSPAADVHRREWVMLCLIVASALMSAYSFWRATTYASDAATQRQHERVATMLGAQDGRHFGALVDFDLGLTTRYCSATAERDAALVDSLPGATGDIGPVVNQIVTQQRLAEARWQLFQANVPTLACPTASEDHPVAAYSVDAAMEWQTAIDPRFGSGGFESVPGDGDPTRSEQRLMVAALAFAVALLFLTVSDLVGRVDSQAPTAPRARTAPWRRWTAWTGLAVAALLTGVTLVALEAPVRDLMLFGAVLLLAVTTVPASAAAVKRRGSPIRRPAHAPTRRRPTRLWAELAGATTLVLLAAVALGLSLVSERERDLRRDADRYAVEADRLLDQGEQDALRDLSTVEELAALDARRAAVNQVALEPTAEAERIAASRAGLASHASAVDDGAAVDSEPTDQAARDEASGCPSRLPDRRTDAGALLADAEAVPMALSDHIAAQSEAGRACNVLAATSRAAADTWDRRAGSFTVALVVLGLAGFLLALAADRERSAAPARWMLRVGVLAAVFGGLVAVSAAVSSTVGAAGRPAGRQFAEKLAAGEVALLQGECDTALDHLNAAIADYTDHGPAYLARAEARVCSPDEEWLFGVPLTPARVDGALRDLAAARDLGVTDPTSELDNGWLHLLHAVHSPDDRDASLAAARASTRAALDQMSDRQSGGAHYARFTLALADLLDGSGRATGDYERAVACLGPSDGCDGLQDEMLRQVYALLALADLELVDTSAASLDDYRALIINGVDPEGSDPAAEAGPVPDLGTWTLDVFPQELQLLSDSAPPDQPVSVVWYYRARPTDTWSVVVDASLQTLVPSMQSTGRPIAVSRDLPTGEYRADILVGGRLAESVRDEPPRYEPEPGYDRVVVSELGFTATVPDGWQRADHAYGVETTFAAPASDGALVIRRAESLTPDGEITEWAASLLDTWVAAIVGDELGDVVPRTEPWGFGADHAVERDYPDAEAWAAMGFVPYVPDHPECGGTALMAMTSGADDETSSSIRDSIVAQSGLLGIPVVDGYAGSEGFALDVSNGWAPLDPGASAERTLLFRAHQCSIGARAEVEVSNAAGTSLDESADTLLGAAELELDGFDIAHRRTRRLQGGQAAVDLEYTFVADGTDVTRRQLLALDGSELYVLTVSTPTGEGDGVVDDLVSSFSLTGSTNGE